jgi:predicted ATP-grasp superfamily ATP-dependent carboligase
MKPCVVGQTLRRNVSENQVSQVLETIAREAHQPAIPIHGSETRTQLAQTRKERKGKESKRKKERKNERTKEKLKVWKSSKNAAKLSRDFSIVDIFVDFHNSEYLSQTMMGKGYVIGKFPLLLSGLHAVSDVAKTSGRPYFAEMYLFSDN